MTIQPIDVEDLLSQELTRMASAQGMTVTCSPPPLEESFPTPHILVTRTGGQQLSLVVDQHQCSVDVRADTWATSTRLADWACGSIRVLPLDPNHLLQWRAASVATFPYANPDPKHPSTPRVTFLAIVTCRATIQ